MLYFASDIHAQYQLFRRLLDKIKFSNTDEMIICGDIVDKGPESVRLAKFVFETPNIKCICGNHEYAFLKYYWSLMKDSPSDYGKLLRQLQAYFPEDGHLLDWDMVDAFEVLPLYIEREEFICVHSGIPLDENGEFMTWDKVTTEELVYGRTFKEPDVLPTTRKCVFFGHTPTSGVQNKEKIIVYPRVNQPIRISDYYKIHLDLGTMTSGMVGCICMDTMEEFYVQKDLY